MTRHMKSLLCSLRTTNFRLFKHTEEKILTVDYPRILKSILISSIWTSALLIYGLGVPYAGVAANTLDFVTCLPSNAPHRKCYQTLLYSPCSGAYNHVGVFHVVYNQWRVSRVTPHSVLTAEHLALGRYCSPFGPAHFLFTSLCSLFVMEFLSRLLSLFNCIHSLLFC